MSRWLASQGSFFGTSWTPLDLQKISAPDSLIWTERGLTLDMAGAVAALDDQGPGGRGYLQNSSPARLYTIDIGGHTYVYGDDSATMWLAGAATWPAWTNFTAVIGMCDFGATQAAERYWDRVSGTGTWIGRRGSSSANDWGGGVKDASTPFGRFVAASDFMPHLIVSRRTGTTHDVWVDSTTIGVTGTVTDTALSVSTPAILAASGGSAICQGGAFLFGCWWPTSLGNDVVADLIIRPAAGFMGRTVT